MLRLLSILFVVISVYVPASAFAENRGTVTCSYFEPSTRTQMSFGYDVDAQIVDAIHEYQVADESEIDVKSTTAGETLSFEVMHYRDGFVIQHDLHEINLRMMDVATSRLNASGEKVGEHDYGYCDSDVEISLDKVADEKCVQLGFGVMMFSDREICVNDHLPETKENTYDAEQLWQEGAWCVSGESQLKAPPTATLKFFPFDGNPNLTARYLIIENGYAKNEKVFAANRRAKTVLLTAGNSLFDAFQLHDTSEIQYIDIGWDVDISEFKFHVLDYYAGAKYDDVCVSMIDAYMEDYPIDPADDLIATPVGLTKEQQKYIAGEGFVDVAEIAIIVPPIRPEALSIPKLPEPTQRWTKEQRPKPLSITEYKKHFGWPDNMVELAIATSADMNFVIIDGGFNGLKQYLAERPKLASRVKYYDLGGGEDNPEGTHGFNVFRVADEVMPAGNIHLFDISISRPGYLDKAIDQMVAKKLNYGTMSIGSFGMADRTTLTDNLPEVLQRLEEHQITLFVSSGNYRDNIQSVSPVDTDGDGFIEFWPDGETDLDKEGLKFGLREGDKAKLRIAWGDRPNETGTVIAQLYNGADLLKEETFDFSNGNGSISYRADKKTPIRLKVGFKDISVPMPLLRVFESGTRHWGDAWNGWRSSGDWAIWDSPFLIPVGSVGEREGKLWPSGFSSIDLSNQGHITPLILGPGQYELESGEVLNGTSFSTPFIAALYASMVNNNIKNMIEATSGFDALAPGLSQYEMGRWGTPEFRKIFGDNDCNNNTYAVRNATIVDDNLEITMALSKRCMEKLSYGISVELFSQDIDQSTGRIGEAVTKTVNGAEKRLLDFKRGKSETKHIVDHEMNFSLPMDEVSSRFEGHKVKAFFYLYTTADPGGSYMFSEDLPVLLPSS